MEHRRDGKEHLRGLELKYLDVLSEPVGRAKFVEEYINAVATGEGAPGSEKLRKELKVLRRKFRGMAARADQATAEADALRKDLNRSERENRELKKILTGVRNSRTMQAGRAVTAPLGWIRSGKKALRSTLR